ncbi:MAG: MiaB/RimO family radical SAM methylthiotransferase [Nitrospiraceae bacterium]|nr:MiaB/RimO family radical SAM methylthiotransferase [Nitrospiraceae bacterium]
MSGVEKRFYVRTFGCQMNEHDSERIAGLLAGEGMSEAPSAEEADVVVLNTCCIRENADNKLYGHLGHLKALKQTRPEMKIVVAGCLAQKDRDSVLERAGWVDVVLGTHNVANVPKLLSRSYSEGRVVEILEAADPELEFASGPTTRADAPYSAYVTIQIGCDNNCAFCIVPSVRGAEISRPFGELLAEVEALADRGVTEVTLLGQNVNSYGRDLTIAARQGGQFDVAVLGGAYVSRPERRLAPLFADLLSAVASVDGIRRVRYTSPHPKDMRPETIAAMAASEQIMNQLHFPLQSGSDRILAAMHRGYTGSRYLEKLAAARAGIDDLAVSTDIIVGFPGETEDDFTATLEVAAEASFDGAYTFIFSPRPGTEAASLEELFVPEAVVAERFERLKVVIDRSAYARHRARVGRVEEVLIEGRSKRNAEMISGRTRQNKLVHFPHKRVPESSERLAAGSYALVEIVDAAPHFLRGELREVTAAPRHRTHLQVAAV